MMRLHGEHLEGRRNMPRSTAYRRKRERPQRNNSSSSSEDEKWREYFQHQLPVDEPSSSVSNESISNHESQLSSLSLSLSTATETDFMNDRSLETLQSLRNEQNNSVQSIFLTDQMRDESTETLIDDYQNPIYGITHSDDDTIEDSWIRDAHEELFESTDNNSEDNDDSDFENNDDSSNDESILLQQNNSFSREESFNRLREMLKEDDSNNDTIDANIVVSKSEILLAVLKFGLTYNLSQTAIADLFKMLNCIFGFTILPETRYLVDQIFSSDSNFEFHAICPNCKMYVKKFNRKKRQVKCNLCNTVIMLKSPTYHDFFVITKIENDIINLIENNEEHYSNIVNNRMENREKFNDFTDGLWYKKFIASLPISERQNFVTSTFNTDGSPVFKSSKFSIWPIQLIINEMPFRVRTSNPIVCGMWFGKDKPKMNIFLKPFVVYMNQLANKGIKCKINNGETVIKVHALCSCVDSVARAPMQGMVQFNGYYGCSWCMHPGIYVPTVRGGSVKYVLLDELPFKRTERETLQYMQESLTSRHPVYGVKRPTCLINLKSFNIISGFVPDSMHSISLGVAEQFLSYWLDTSGKPYSLSNDDINKANDILLLIKAPNQIARLSRCISDRSWWKAREFENWTLYYSIPILLSFPHMLPYVKHWGYLVEAFYILLKDNITRMELDRADLLLKKFVAYTEVYYSANAMMYNIHQLLHMAQSVVDWGPLWSHSGYCFESGNGQLVRQIQAAKGVLYQLCRLIAMRQSEFILKKYITTRPYSAIHNFITYLDKKKAVVSLKLLNARYFGPYKRTTLQWIQQLGLSNQSRTYRKMVKNKCLYTSCKKRNLRSNNSFAITKTGVYIRLVEFIIDEPSRIESTLCNQVNVENIFEGLTVVKKIVNIDDEVQIIKTDDIDRICVFIDTGDNKYICSVPNLFIY